MIVLPNHNSLVSFGAISSEFGGARVSGLARGIRAKISMPSINEPKRTTRYNLVFTVGVVNLTIYLVISG